MGKFYQDYDSEHTALDVPFGCSIRVPNSLKRRLNLRDLNHTEHICLELEPRIRKYNISSETQLKFVIPVRQENIYPPNYQNFSRINFQNISIYYLGEDDDGYVKLNLCL